MKSNSINILFAGDFAPCRGFEEVVLNKGQYIFGDLREDVGRADLSFLNLETPLCVNGNPIEKCGSNIRANPDCIKAVADAGFDVVGLANNHIMDFGEIGLYETMKACEKADLVACGAGKSLEEAQRIHFIKSKGLKIAFIAVAEHEFSISGPDKAGAAPLDPIDNTHQIEQARKQADLVFVTIHGGIEYYPFPRPGLRKLCRFYINRGADAVICHHAHVPSAYEFYKDKPIVYSLGNLIFDHVRPPKDWVKGYAVLLEYSDNTKALNSFKIIPYTQKVSQGGVHKMYGKEKSDFFKQLSEYKRILGSDEDFKKKWNSFCQRKKNIILLKQYFPVLVPGLNKISSLINLEKFLIPTKNSIFVKLNMIRCESHLELLQAVLDEEYRRIR